MPALRGGLLLTIALGTAALAQVATRSPAASPSTTSVRLPGAGVELGGILVRPSVAGPRPAIILLHGYQPAGTNGAALMEPAAVRFAAQGYVALALSMRGWPPSGGKDDCGLHQPDDVAAALTWLAAQPGVDENRLAILGLSQGGQVALLTGARTQRLRAIVAAYPVTDVARWKVTTTFSGIPDYIRNVCEPGGTDRRSPLSQAARIQSPVLLIHGDADTRVPTEQSLLMRNALERAGRDVRLLLVPGAAHGFPINQNPVSRAALAAFLTEKLGSN